MPPRSKCALKKFSEPDVAIAADAEISRASVAAATMAGAEQGGKADQHDHMHNGFDRCALAVFKSNFRSSCFSGQDAGSGGHSAVQCETTVSE